MFTLSHDIEALQREAARMGPGYRQEGRKTATPEAREQLVARFREAEMMPPDFLLNDHRWVDRRAKLFEAGDYPDKGVSVSIHDLAAIEAAFDLPVPVLIEHRESPLQLGFLVGVERLGSELFGTIALTEEADALVQQSSAKRLSVGLAPDLRSIREVSLVRHPRVADAAMFHSDGVCFDGSLVEPKDLRQAWHEFHQQQREADARNAVEQYVDAGKLMPSQREVAFALLSCQGAVRVGTQTWTVSELAAQLLDRQMPAGLFSELAPDITDSSDLLLMPEEVAFYRRHFPDVELTEIARRKGGRA